MTDDYEKAQYIIQKWIDIGHAHETLMLCSLNIETLPPLPTTVNKLYISHISSIRCIELPNNLKELDIIFSDIQEISNIPSTLRSLTVSCCKNLKCLPELPNALTYLSYHHYESYVKLPKLPNTLTHIYISNNPLVELPDLPNSLLVLDVHNTDITELPEHLPEDLMFLYISGTKIKRLPDILPERIRRLSYYFTTDIFHYLPMYIDLNEFSNPHEYHKRVKTFEKNIKNIKQELELYISKKRTVKRCKAIKERLMAATWHPDRVLDWCDPKAFDYED